jgi:hypothetical protein
MLISIEKKTMNNNIDKYEWIFKDKKVDERIFNKKIDKYKWIFE